MWSRLFIPFPEKIPVTVWVPPKNGVLNVWSRVRFEITPIIAISYLNSLIEDKESKYELSENNNSYSDFEAA